MDLKTQEKAGAFKWASPRKTILCTQLTRTCMCLQMGQVHVVVNLNQLLSAQSHLKSSHVCFVCHRT